MLPNRSSRHRRDPIPTEICYLAIETSISHLGEIVEVPVNVPHYNTYHASIVATGKEASSPG